MPERVQGLRAFGEWLHHFLQEPLHLQSVGFVFKGVPNLPTAQIPARAPFSEAPRVGLPRPQRPAVSRSFRRAPGWLGIWAVQGWFDAGPFEPPEPGAGHELRAFRAMLLRFRLAGIRALKPASHTAKIILRRARRLQIRSLLCAYASKGLKSTKVPPKQLQFSDPRPQAWLLYLRYHRLRKEVDCYPLVDYLTNSTRARTCRNPRFSKMF